MDKKAFMQMSFAWIFALLVGAFILFLAIFASIKLTSTEGLEQSAIASKGIGVLLNPLETGFEEGQTNLLKLDTETRIYARCSEEDEFGKQLIQTFHENFGKWSEAEINVSFRNKYIFAEQPIQGRNFLLFSKPFEFPFKVTDLIYIIPLEKEYCFVGAPPRINQEISDLKIPNIYNKTTSGKCPPESTKVCFAGTSGCEIKVNDDAKTVNKGSGNVNHTNYEGDALMYASIFSDKATYECQLQRLMKRVESLALLYNEKSIFISQQGCSNNLDLFGLASMANSTTSSADLRLRISDLVEIIKKSNERNSYCRLW